MNYRIITIIVLVCIISIYLIKNIKNRENWDCKSGTMFQNTIDISPRETCDGLCQNPRDNGFDKIKEAFQEYFNTGQKQNLTLTYAYIPAGEDLTLSPDDCPSGKFCFGHNTGEMSETITASQKIKDVFQTSLEKWKEIFNNIFKESISISFTEISDVHQSNIRIASIDWFREIDTLAFGGGFKDNNSVQRGLMVILDTFSQCDGNDVNMTIANKYTDSEKREKYCNDFDTDKLLHNELLLTLVHELGHVFGLDHNRFKNNGKFSLMHCDEDEFDIKNPTLGKEMNDRLLAIYCPNLPKICDKGKDNCVNYDDYFNDKKYLVKKDDKDRVTLLDDEYPIDNTIKCENNNNCVGNAC